jgi:hypothetical protein
MKEYYKSDKCVVFGNMRKDFGGLSNTAEGYVMKVNENTISNPLIALIYSQKHVTGFTRKDWLDVKTSDWETWVVFWGIQKEFGMDELSGENRLGKLLVKLQDFYRNSTQEQIETVELPAIANFRFFGKELTNDNSKKL